MSPQSPVPDDPKPSSPIPFSDALIKAIENQKNPLFLLLIAYAIIVVGASIFGLEILKTLVVPLGVVFVVGVVAWLVYEGFKGKSQRPTRVPQHNEGGSVDVGAGARVEGSKGIGGKAIGRGGSQKGGDVKLGLFSNVKDSTLKGGDAEAKDSDGSREKKRKS